MAVLLGGWRAAARLQRGLARRYLGRAESGRRVGRPRSGRGGGPVRDPMGGQGNHLAAGPAHAPPPRRRL